MPASQSNCAVYECGSGSGGDSRLKAKVVIGSGGTSQVIFLVSLCMMHYGELSALDRIKR